jgi:hypothetical protein
MTDQIVRRGLAFPATRRRPRVEPEKSFQARIVEYAHLCGWETHHEFDSRHSSEGWPDLELVRGKRHIRAEVKRAREEPEPHQERILGLLGRVPELEVYVWHEHDCGRPGHHAWLDILRTLGRHS